MLDQERLASAVFRVESMSGDISDIKTAVRELAAAVSRLAIIEERQVHDRADAARISVRVDGHEGRINALELAQPLQQQATTWIGKAVWLVVGAVISGVLAMVLVTRAPSAPRFDNPQLTMPSTK
jgi:outer membrane murein-binding lipoprotein Lpp